MAAGKSPLFVKKQPGGHLAIIDQSMTTGDVFFVHSGTGTDGAGYGRNPDAPFATIEFAVSQCTDSKADRIYVMPGHAEVVATVGALALDVIGIRVIGLGNGTIQPTITLTDTASTITIGAASVTVENVNLVPGDDDVAVCFDVNATDFTVRGSRFTSPTATKNFHICVQDGATTTTSRITIEGCSAIQNDALNTHFVNFAGTGDGHIVRDNILIGDWGTMCIGGAGVITNAVIVNNLIANKATDADACINIEATVLGVCARNAVGMGHATDAITATAMTESENYAALVTEDLQGVLEPAAT